MTDIEILTAAIKKAQANGWYPDHEFALVSNYDGNIGTSMRVHGAFDDDGTIEKWSRDAETLIFSHYFARKFWGQRYVCSDCGNALYEPHIANNPKIKPDELPHAYTVPAWIYYLPKMILESNPIQYLSKFL